MSDTGQQLSWKRKTRPRHTAEHVPQDRSANLSAISNRPKANLYAARSGDATFQGGSRFEMTVNYNLRPTDLIATSNYDWHSPSIVFRTFQSNRSGIHTVSLVLLQFGGIVQSAQVYDELTARKLRPADLTELLTFGKNEPELQRTRTLIGLGCLSESIGKHYYVPCLCGDWKGRLLDISWIGSSWFKICLFPAICVS